jgi:hypothetical protein
MGWWILRDSLPLELLECGVRQPCDAQEGFFKRVLRLTITHISSGRARSVIMLKWIMKKTVIILLLCFPAIAYASPVIRFESETHNFGHVVQGELQEYSFDFTNAGTDELVIQRISPS